MNHDMNNLFIIPLVKNNLTILCNIDMYMIKFMNIKIKSTTQHTLFPLKTPPRCNA